MKTLSTRKEDTPYPTGGRRNNIAHWNKEGIKKPPLEVAQLYRTEHYVHN
jgi:hypothetical protein